MASSTVRYGKGVTQEVGMDMANMKAKRVCVMTDPNLINMGPVNTTLNSLTKNNIQYEVFDQVRVEPTDERWTSLSGWDCTQPKSVFTFSSLQVAIKFAKEKDFDAYIAVGGGSVMDTCKAANLYSCDPEAEFLDYVNAPIGKGKPVTVPLKPLVASRLWFKSKKFLKENWGCFYETALKLRISNTILIEASTWAMVGVTGKLNLCQP